MLCSVHLTGLTESLLTIKQGEDQDFVAYKELHVLDKVGQTIPTALLMGIQCLKKI